MEKSIYIVLVNYNGQKDTDECITSLKKNIYMNYKIIIIDNCSSVGNVSDLTKKWNDLIIVKNSKNEGFAKANNLGIEIALNHGADYILLLNNDTIVEPNFLEKMVYRAQNVMADVLTCKIMYNGDKNKIWYGGGKINWKKGYGIHYINNELKTDSVIDFASGCCMLINRETAKNFRLPEDYFMYFEDVDFCANLINNHKTIYYTPEIKIYHKVSASTGIESPFFVYYWNRNRLIFLKKYRYKIGNIRCCLSLSFFLFTRVIKSFMYLGKGEFEKNRKMLEGVKSGLNYKIKEDMLK